MSVQEVVIEGTLKPDGTLELDRKPNLPPGRVTVVLRQETAASPQENWWHFMQRTRLELEGAGSRFMDERELQAHIEWVREPDRIDEMLRETEEQRPSGEPS